MNRPFPQSLGWPVVAGSVGWVLLVVFFVGQAIAQAATTAPYSFSGSYISDLGNTACGPFTAGTYHAIVCSPLHTLMNATFVVSGLLTAAGAIGTWRAWLRRRLTTVGLILLALGGIGQALVGFTPENVNLGLHGLWALFGIAGANLGVLLLGFGHWRPARSTAVPSLLVGAVGLISFALLGGAGSLGLGIGLVERLAVYPLVLWMIAVGGFLLVRASSASRGRPGDLRA